MMKAFAAILILLPPAITDTIEDDPQNLQHDEDAFKRRPSPVLDEMLSLLHMQTIRSSYDNWVLKNPILESPSEIIDSKIISFTHFIKDEDMPLSKIPEISCLFGYHLKMKFEELTQTGVKLQGNIQFVGSGDISSCRVPFIYDFFIGCVNFQIYDKPVMKKVKNKPPDGLSVSIMNAKECVKIGKIMPGKPDEKSCQDIAIDPKVSNYTIQHDPLEAAVIKAITNRIEKRLEHLAESIFQTVSYKCLHPKKVFDEEMKNNFRYESNHNTVAFPWMCDHHELIFGGLNDVKSLSIRYQPDGAIDFYKIDYDKFKIRWNTVSIVQKRVDIEPASIHIEVSPIARNITIKARRLKKKYNDQILNINKDEKSVFQELFVDGITQMMRETLHWGTGFTDIVGGILQVLNEKPLRNLFVNFKAEVNENLHTGSPTFFKIQTEDLDFETTCKSGNLKINKLRYKKISAEVELAYPLKKGNFLFVLITAEIYLKEAHFNISMHRHSNGTHRVQIDENLNQTDTTIMITSNHYHLQRGDRIEIGRRIVNDLIAKIRNQIINAAKSTFSPIFDVCENSSMSTTIQPNPSGHQYSVVIRDYWTNTSEFFQSNQVDVTVEGFGSFKFINVQCSHENVLVDGLRLENVTGSIIQIYDSNEMVRINYRMSYLSLLIRHTEKYVRVEFPEQSQYVFSKMPNISLSVEDTIVLKEKFQSTVAFFIEKSFYNDDSNYRKKFRKIVESAMKKVITDDQSQFDNSKRLRTGISTLITSYLPIFWSKFKLKDEDDYNYSFNQTKLLFEKLHFSITIDLTKKIMAKFTTPIDQEEICNFSNHFQGNYTGIRLQINLIATLQIDILVDQISLLVPFKEKSYYTLGEDSRREIMYQVINSQVDINEKHMQVLIHDTNTMFPLDNISMQKAYKQLIILRANRSPITFKNPSFCSQWKDIATGNEEMSEKHFYLIPKTIDYAFDHFLTFYILLYGLHHTESLRAITWKSSTKYEMTMTNITAEIIYSYYIGDLPPNVPKKLRVKIDKISLHCVIDRETGELTYTNQSQVQLSNDEKLRKLEKFKETFKLTILHSIQKSIEVKYYSQINSYTKDPFSDNYHKSGGIFLKFDYENYQSYGVI